MAFADVTNYSAFVYNYLHTSCGMCCTVLIICEYPFSEWYGALQLKTQVPTTEHGRLLASFLILMSARGHHTTTVSPN